MRHAKVVLLRHSDEAPYLDMKVVTVADLPKRLSEVLSILSIKPDNLGKYLIILNGSPVASLSIQDLTNLEIHEDDKILLVESSLKPEESLSAYLLSTFIDDIDLLTCIARSKDIVKELDKYQRDNCIVQVVPPNILTSEYHIKLASYYAFTSFRRGFSISRRKHLEFLLYLVGDRQVSKVIRLLQEAARTVDKVVLITACIDRIPADLKHVMRSELCAELITDLDKFIDENTDLNILSRILGTTLKSKDEAREHTLMKTIELYLRTR